MGESAVTYPNWKAPAGDSQMLIWPEPAKLLRDTDENHRKLQSADRPRLHGILLTELRRQMRSWIGHSDDAQPLIATGHQTELIHSGVWAKNVLMNAAMHKLGGEAYFFAVDTDSPKHLQLRWPEASIPITDDASLTTATWSGQLDAPSPSHLQYVQDQLASAAKNWSFEPAIMPFLRALRRLSLESLNLSAALVSAMHELEWELSLRHHAMVIAPMWFAEPYLIFVHYIASNAARFAWQYNAALADYRKAHRLRSNVRPMPDLATSTGECEIPFWLDHLDTGERDRAMVVRIDNRWVLRLRQGEEFSFDEKAHGSAAGNALLQWLRSHDLRLSPRAITLTMFLRLFIADQFVHGIGGGRYDQVTDQLIQTHFKLEPPKFSVTTATMYFPDAAGKSRICLPCLEQKGHHLRHSLLGAEKQELVEQIAAAPRHSPQRRELFSQMHRKLTEVWRDNPVLAQWEKTVEQARQAESKESALFDRELFFAIQPKNRLETLIKQYSEALG